MASSDTLRVGIVGAGGIVRSRNLPGLRAMPGVEVVGLANRSRESSERAAAELEVPRVYDSWLELVQDPTLDAVCIGTWPYMHMPVTLAALENDKHVLTEGRMAMNACEAHAMLDASRRKPHLVTQIVPGPPTFAVDNMLIELVNSGFLGDILSVRIRALPIGQQSANAFINREAPFHWRMDADVSGINALSIGIEYESMMRWLGPVTKVFARAKTFVKHRQDSEGRLHPISLPDHVDVLADLACGGQLHLTVSTLTGFGPQHLMWFFGTQGTIKVEGDRVFVAKRAETEFTELPNPQDQRYRWRAEEEFVNAIRGKEKVTRTPFDVGVQYMEFSEAVQRSSRTGEAVYLPLDSM